MVDVLDSVIGAIVVAYVLRVGYYVVVKRQRMDWHSERKRFKQELERMLRIMKRLSRYILRGWH